MFMCNTSIQYSSVLYQLVLRILFYIDTVCAVHSLCFVLYKVMGYGSGLTYLCAALSILYHNMHCFRG